MFTEFEYQTARRWSRARRVIAKAEVSTQGDNPRFLVTNLLRSGNAAPAPGPARFDKGVERQIDVIVVIGVVGDLPLWAQLRTADHGAAHGAVAALEKIVAAIR